VVVSLALFTVILPYCVAKALAGLTAPDVIGQLKTLNESMETHTKLLASLANNTPAMIAPVSNDVSGG
jgi:hypothetical protein